MKKILILGGILLTLVLSTNCLAEDKKPVDEANEVKVKEDKVKGGEALKDVINSQTIQLSDIKDVYTIKRDKDLYFPPYRCFIYSNGKEIEIGISENNNFDFDINKSLLSVGDIIVITNRQDVITDSPVKKLIVEEVEVK